MEHHFLMRARWLTSVGVKGVGGTTSELGVARPFYRPYDAAGSEAGITSRPHTATVAEPYSEFASLKASHRCPREIPHVHRTTSPRNIVNYPCGFLSRYRNDSVLGSDGREVLGWSDRDGIF